MNIIHTKNNIYKSGKYIPAHRIKTQYDKAKEIEPTSKKIKYRDDLYKFCVKKGIAGDKFGFGRTKREITANINALITILKKHGLDDEFFDKNNSE